MLIALKDYAAMHGRAHNSARRMAERGSFDTAVKIACAIASLQLFLALSKLWL